MSLAVAVGLYHNDVAAIIEDDAAIDASRDTTIQSTLAYPLLTAGVGAALNPLETFQNLGLDAFEEMADGALGLSQLYNVYLLTLSGSTGDELVIAGGVGYTETDNNVTARIGDRVRVNQNPSVTATTGREVLVRANLDSSIVEAGQQAALNLSFDGIAESIADGNLADPSEFASSLVNPFGVSGAKAAGGIALLAFGENNILAEIGDAAVIDAGDQGVLVIAAEDSFHFTAVQTGVSSTDFGFAASIAVAKQDNVIHARVGDGALIRGGGLAVTANDDYNRIGIAGAFLKGEQAGIGVSIGVNLIDQDVAAIIGRIDNLLQTDAPENTTLDLSGALFVSATTEGNIFALVMGGALQGIGGESSGDDSSGGGGSSRGGGSQRASGDKIGSIALSIPVAYNEVNADIRALLDRQRVDAGLVSMTADGGMDIQSIAVGASFAIQTGGNDNGKLDLAGVGAIAINTIDQDVTTSVTDSDVTVDLIGAFLNANNSAAVLAVAGGLAVAVDTTREGKLALSFGVSVGINDIVGDTTAAIDRSVWTGEAGDLQVVADSDGSIQSYAIAGAASLRGGGQSSGSFGLAGAAAINDIATTTTARIGDGSDIIVAGGTLTVDAFSRETIEANAGGVGLGLGFGQGTTITGAVGVGIAINEIDSDIAAVLDDSQVRAAGGVNVLARSTAEITALAIAASVGVSGSKGTAASIALAGSAALNDIGGSIHASIEGGRVNAGDDPSVDDVTAGPVFVSAQDVSTIDATAIGANVAVAISGQTGVAIDVGVSIGINEIGRSVRADLRDVDELRSFELTVSAQQAATITAQSFAASIGVSGGRSIAVVLSGAGALSLNEITNRTFATIQNSDVRFTDRVDVTASELATIDSFILSVGVALGAAKNGIAAAVGISIADNQIGDPEAFTADPTAIGEDSAQVKAFIVDSSIRARESVRVDAQANGSVTAESLAVSVAAGAGKVGVALGAVGVSATNDVAFEVISLVDDSTIRVDSGPTGDLFDNPAVSVSATAQTSVTTDVEGVVVAFAAGKFAAGISVSVSTTTVVVENKVLANVHDTRIDVAAGNVVVEALEDVFVDADSTSSAVAVSVGLIAGAIAGGGAIVDVDLTSTIDATVSGGRVSTPNDLSINGRGVHVVEADTSGLAVALSVAGLGVSGSVTTADVSPTITAKLENAGTDVGGLRVGSIHTPSVDTNAEGIAVGSFLGVGVSRAVSRIDPTVNAIIDGDSANSLSFETIVTADSVSLSATVIVENSTADASAGSGGFAISSATTIAEVEHTGSVKAEIGDGTWLNVNGFVTIDSTQVIDQHADAEAYSAAVNFAAGVPLSDAIADIQTDIRIGDDVAILADGFLANAIGEVQQTAAASAGAGALTAAAAVAVPATSSTSQTKFELGNNSDISIAGPVLIQASQRDEFNSTLTSGVGGLLSGGGGGVDNTVDTDTLAVFGPGSRIDARSIDTNVLNSVFKPDLGIEGNLDITVGGLLAGGGVRSDTDLSLRANIHVEDAAKLMVVSQDPSDQNDTLRLRTHNEINATDRATVGSGGLFAGSGMNIDIRTTINEAKIDIAENAELSSSGDVSLTARGGGGARIQGNAETYGAATVGVSDVAISITPTNTIDIRGAITAGGDINVGAGTDPTAGVVGSDRYMITSRLDTVSGALIPIDVINAAATLVQTNVIDVGATGDVRSSGDIRLHAETFILSDVVAGAKGISWVSDDGGTIGEGGIEILDNELDVRSEGTVIVNGRVETGLGRNKRLEITSVTLPDGADDSVAGNYQFVIDDSSTGDVPFTQTVTRQRSFLEETLQDAINNRERYRDNSALLEFYEAEVARIINEIDNQGLLSNNIPVARTTPVLVVGPVSAHAGLIDIRGETLTLDGDLIAPGDASVEIINRSIASLEIVGIDIADSNGGVFRNGVRDGNADTDTPSVLVSNVAIPGSNQVWPDIRVTGSIQNLAGDVVLTNPASSGGTINVNDNITAADVRINAGSQGNVIVDVGLTGQNEVAAGGRQTVFETGGAAHKAWQELTGNTLVDGGAGNGTGPAEGSWRPGRSSNSFNHSPKPEVDEFLDRDPDLAISGANVAITAQFINVNSIIEAGKSEYRVVIGDDVAAEVASLEAAFGSEATVVFPIFAGSSTNDLGLRYDLGRDRLMVDPLQTRGGRIELTGRIANTHNGQLKVLGGFPSIEVVNSTDIDLELGRIDVSARGEGSITINDFAKTNPDPSAPITNPPSVTTYRRNDNSVEMTFNDGGQQSVVRSINPSGVEDDDLNYKPDEGQRYNWIIGTDVGTETTTTYQVDFTLGLDFLNPDPGAIVGAPVVRTFTQPRLLDAGVFFTAGADDAPRYQYDLSSTSLVSRVQGPFGVDSTCGFLCLTESVRYNIIVSEVTRQRHLHSIRADREITIDYTGESEGVVSITSIGNVFFADSVTNPLGTTVIIAGGTVQSTGDQGVVGGRSLSVLAGRGIGFLGDGENDVPLKIDSTDPTTNNDRSGVTLVSGNGPIVVSEVSGDLPIISVQTRTNTTQGDVANGDITLIAAGSITTVDPALFESPDVLIVGDAIRLVSNGGGIGSIPTGTNNGQAITIGPASPTLTSVHSIDARVAGDIYLNPSATVRVGRIIAGGDVRIDMDTFDGVLLDGDKDFFEDARSIAELGGSVYADLRLTQDRGADDKIAERIAALEERRTRGYFDYWNVRNTQFDPAVYDPDFKVSFEDAERIALEEQFRAAAIEQGIAPEDIDAFVADAIQTLGNSRTTAYHIAHNEFGSLTEAFDPDYQYEATDDEREQIFASIKIWTDEELRTLVNARFVNGTDTEFFVEAENISAVNVTLNIPDGIGRYENGLLLDNRPRGEGGLDPLTPLQRALINSAEPNDIVYLADAPVEIDRANLSIGVDEKIRIEILSVGGLPLDWAELGFGLGDRVHLETDFGPATDRGFFATVESGDGRSIVLTLIPQFSLPIDVPFRPLTVARVIGETESPADADFIRVLRREDLDVKSTGVIDVDSLRHVFLGSSESFSVRRIHAGSNFRNQIKVEGDVTAADDGTEPHIMGDRIVIESSQRGIGSVDRPIRVDVRNGGYLTARAEDAVVLRGDVGLMSLFQVFSNTAIDLTSTQMIRDALVLGNEILAAPEIRLSANEIGSASVPIRTNLTAGGVLTATALFDVHIDEMVGNLHVRHVRSALGDVTLSADGSIFDSVDVVDPSVDDSPDADPLPGLPATDVLGQSITLTSRSGSIGSLGNELDIESAHQSSLGESSVNVSAAESVYLNGLGDRLRLGRVDATEAFIASLFGPILTSDPDLVNLTAGNLWLFANGDIGSSTAPLRSAAARLEGRSTSGDVYLRNDGDLIIGGVINPPGNGSDASGESIVGTSFDGFSAFGRMELSTAGALSVQEVLRSRSRILVSAGDVNVPSGGGLVSDANIFLNVGANFTAQPGSRLVAPVGIGTLQTSGGNARVVWRGAVESPLLSINTIGGDDLIELDPSSFTGQYDVGLGDGSDRVLVGSGEFIFLNGGDGEDSLEVIGGNVDLDLTTFRNNQFRSFEIIDLRGDGPNRLSIEPRVIAGLSQNGNRSVLIHDADDVVDYGEGWIVTLPELADGQLQHNLEGNDARLAVRNTSPFSNPVNRYDVNRSGIPTELDALIVINTLNRLDAGETTLSILTTADQLDDFVYFDVNGDGNVTAIDALQIINELNRNSFQASGEDVEPLALAATLQRRANADAWDRFHSQSLHRATHVDGETWNDDSTRKAVASFDSSSVELTAQKVDQALVHDELIRETILESSSHLLNKTIDQLALSSPIPDLRRDTR